MSSILHRIDSSENRLNEKLMLFDEFAQQADLGKDLKFRLRHALLYSSEKTGFSWSD